jgi:hypothetical protein
MCAVCKINNAGTFVWPSDSNYQHRRHIDFLPWIARVGILSGSANRHPPGLVIWGKSKPEAQVVVAVVRLVPVAIG